MKRASCWRIPAALVLLFGTALPSAADPIQITGGFLEMRGSLGTISLAGDRGFTLNATVSDFGGISPRSRCIPCEPGTTLDLFAFWNGSDLSGTATLDGRLLDHLGSSGVRDPSGEVTFRGAAGPVPAAVGTSATLVAPFTFEGLLRYVQNPEASSGDLIFLRQGLFGSGTATIRFGRTEGIPSWTFSGATYQFENLNAVPEPTTMLLVGAGLAAAGARRWRKAPR